MNKTRIAILIFIAIVIIGLAAWFGLRHHSSAPASVPKTPQETSVSYVLFTDKDNGTTTSPLSIGSIVVIQLPDTIFKEPVTITDATGNPFSVNQQDYSGSTVISFPVGTTTNGIEVSSASSTKPFSIRINIAL